jgi:hypothetical protein
MARIHTPIVLELAPLPREQVGPFLLLGLPKDADSKQIEAHWAQRVIWARKNQINVPLEDVNWGREILNDPDRRVRADAASFNLDTQEETLKRLARRYEAPGAAAGTGRPQDVEKPLADYAPDVEVPEVYELHQAVAVPEVPEEFPAVAALLDRLARQPLDPWALTIPSQTPEEPPV